ncbi:MAG: OmpA family protein [Beijerinckiaceae bacterium]|nr:OmpA family protein [Beijerinckiaceae bacterium]
MQNTPPGATGRPDQRPQPGATTAPTRDQDQRGSSDRDGRDRTNADRDRDGRDRDGRDRDGRDNAGRDRDGRDRNQASDFRDRPRFEERDGRTFTRQDDNRIIIRQGDREIIRHDETERLRRGNRDVDVIDRPNGRREVVIVRPNGDRVVTIVDRDGNLLRRIRRDRSGSEFVLIDNERRRPASGFYAPVELPPLRLNIPRERYIVEADEASYDVIEDTLMAPPVERVERAYSLDEVRNNQRLREKVRRVDIDTINFDTGSAAIAPTEAARLDNIARALNDAIRKSPNEVFLIEGHTDAVGSDTSNLSLSDQRAESVATILSQNYQIPPENLVTQGYGEQYLKVQTEAAERQNRRVTLRRITPLLQESQAK